MTTSIGFQTELINSTQFFVAALYDTSDVSTLLEKQQVPKSGGVYPPDFQVTFLTNLQQNKVYRCILWESPDDTATGVSRISGDFKASLSSIKFRSPLYLTADISAGLASGTSGYVDPTNSLNGWDYELEQIGYGTLELGSGKDYTEDGNNNWTLVNGSVITNLQKFVIHFLPQVSVAAPPPISSITSGRTITVSENLTAASKNKALYIKSASSNIQVRLPDISTVADYDHFVLYSSGGSHINAIIPTFGTDQIQLNELVTQIILGQAEKLDVFKANGVWNIDYLSPTFFMVGEIIWKYSRNDLNLVFGDGRTLLRADYPRLYGHLDNIDATAITSEVLWGGTSTADGQTYFPKRACYTRGDGSTNFRIPQLYSAGFLRAIDGGFRTPASLQLDALMDHQSGTLTGSFPGNPNGVGPVGNYGGYNGTLHLNNDLTTHPGQIIGGSFTLLTRVDAKENRPQNTGAYLSIRI